MRAFSNFLASRCKVRAVNPVALRQVGCGQPSFVRFNGCEDVAKPVLDSLDAIVKPYFDCGKVEQPFVASHIFQTFGPEGIEIDANAVAARPGLAIARIDFNMSNVIALFEFNQVVNDVLRCVQKDIARNKIGWKVHCFTHGMGPLTPTEISSPLLCQFIGSYQLTFQLFGAICFNAVQPEQEIRINSAASFIALEADTGVNVDLLLEFSARFEIPLVAFDVSTDVSEESISSQPTASDRR
jgi:hypothetical protein